ARPLTLLYFFPMINCVSIPSLLLNVWSRGWLSVHQQTELSVDGRLLLRLRRAAFRRLTDCPDRCLCVSTYRPLRVHPVYAASFLFYSTSIQLYQSSDSADPSPTVTSRVVHDGRCSRTLSPIFLPPGYCSCQSDLYRRILLYPHLIFEGLLRSSAVYSSLNLRYRQAR